MHTRNNLLSLFFKEAARGPTKPQIEAALKALQAKHTNLEATNRRLRLAIAGTKGGWTTKLKRAMRDAAKAQDAAVKDAKKDAGTKAGKVIAKQQASHAKDLADAAKDKKDAVRAAKKDAGTKAGKVIAKQQASHAKDVAKLESEKSRAKKMYGTGGFVGGGGVVGGGTYAVMRKGDDEGAVDYGKAEGAPSKSNTSVPDPVTYGAGGALLGGGVSHVWGKLADRPDLARDLIVAIGTGLAGATYAASQGNNA